MNVFEINIFAVRSNDDGHREFTFLEITTTRRSGSLFGLQVCGDGGIAFDFFWLGLAIEQTK